MAKTVKRRDRFQEYAHPANVPKFHKRKRLGVTDAIVGTAISQVGNAQSRYSVSINGMPLSLATSGGLNIPILKNQATYPIWVESNSELYESGTTESFVFCLTERDPDDLSIITKTMVYSFDGTIPRVIHTFYSNDTFQLKANSVLYGTDHRCFIVAGTNAIDGSNLALKFTANSIEDVSTGFPPGRILSATYGYFDKKFYYMLDDGAGGCNIARFYPPTNTWESPFSIGETPVSLDSSWYNRLNIHIATTTHIYEYNDAFGLINVFDVTPGSEIKDFNDSTTNVHTQPVGLTVVEVTGTTATIWTNGFEFQITPDSIGFVYRWFSTGGIENVGQVVVYDQNAFAFADTSDTTKTISLCDTSGVPFSPIYTGRSNDGSTIGQAPFYNEGDLRFAVGYIRNSDLKSIFIVFIPHANGIDMWGYIPGSITHYNALPKDGIKLLSDVYGVSHDPSIVSATATSVTLDDAYSQDLTGALLIVSTGTASTAFIAGQTQLITSNAGNTINVNGWIGDTPTVGKSVEVWVGVGAFYIDSATRTGTTPYYEKTFSLAMDDDDHFIIGGMVGKLFGN